MTEPAETNFDLIVVGGGAAGIFAAINLAQLRPEFKIAVLEGGHKFLTKVEISGGGRCNVTHSCYEPKRLIVNYPRGEKELLGPFNRFQPRDMENWLRERGVELKTETDGRVFPITDSSKTIIDCFINEATKLGVDLLPRTGVTGIKKLGDKFSIETKNRTFQANKVLLATGSSHSGHKLAEALGHKITPLAPSLFTFKIKSPLLFDLAGTSFQSTELTLTVLDKTFKNVGPLLITHWGLSGPAVLKLSSIAARELFQADYSAKLLVNWNSKCLNAEEELNKFKASNPKKTISANSMLGFTQRFWKNLCTIANIEENLTYADTSKVKLQALANAISKTEFSVYGKGEFKEEFVTCGGVSLAEVNFKTMESKLCEGLYFAGEVLDIDGVTGGFNFQSAWTGGWHVAQSMAF
jgi:predicted Rossmann fold flavoprotein